MSAIPPRMPPPGPTFSPASRVSALANCTNPCALQNATDDNLVQSVADRVKRLTGEQIQTQGKLPGDFGPQLSSPDATKCQRMAFRMGETVREFNRYREALPYAKAALDVNKLGDKSGSEANPGPCLERLPDDGAGLSKALNLPAGVIADEDLRDDTTGFRAAVYRTKADGKLILVPRDTQPHSLVDWKTNTDNGSGLDSDQYFAMRRLSGKLDKFDVPFDLAGYSKGGGLAQEGGLMATKAKVYVFNSSGLNEASLRRTAASSFDQLAERTKSFSAEGDFLTYMNQTTDPARQIANARYLRRRLGGSMSPISVDYRNPATLAAEAERDALICEISSSFASGGPLPDEIDIDKLKKVDPAFKAARQSYLQELDNLVKGAQDQVDSGQPIRLFPPVRAGSHETIPESMTFFGKLLGARKDEANLGRLLQHLMSNVASPMEDIVEGDRKKLKAFLGECG